VSRSGRPERRGERMGYPHQALEATKPGSVQQPGSIGPDGGVCKVLVGVGGRAMSARGNLHRAGMLGPRLQVRARQRSLCSSAASVPSLGTVAARVETSRAWRLGTMSARDRVMGATCHSPPRHGLLFSGSGGVVADAASYARARQCSDAGTLFAESGALAPAHRIARLGRHSPRSIGTRVSQRREHAAHRLRRWDSRRGRHRDGPAEHRHRPAAPARARRLQRRDEA
jgi:hypothetical protein